MYITLEDFLLMCFLFLSVYVVVSIVSYNLGYKDGRLEANFIRLDETKIKKGANHGK